MRIGIGLVGLNDSVQQLVARYGQIEEQGFQSVWTSNIFSHDAITLSALAGATTSSVELGTFVVPTYPRHPMALAQQALTAQGATNNRLLLGIGLSHRMIIEGMMGLDYSKPVRHMREYLSVLVPLLEGEAVAFEGEEFRVHGQITVPGAERPPVIVAALGPQMLRVAGRMADGTAVWMGGPSYLENDCIPVITQAAAEAGRPAPRVVAGFPMALTSDIEGAKANAARQFAAYADIPSYRAIIEKNGEGGPQTIAMVGDEAELRRQITHLRDIGVTDFSASPFPVKSDHDAIQRTTEFVAALAREGL